MLRVYRGHQYVLKTYRGYQYISKDVWVVKHTESMRRLLVSATKRLLFNYKCLRADSIVLSILRCRNLTTGSAKTDIKTMPSLISRKNLGERKRIRSLSGCTWMSGILARRAVCKSWMSSAVITAIRRASNPNIEAGWVMCYIYLYIDTDSGTVVYTDTH